MIRQNHRGSGTTVSSRAAMVFVCGLLSNPLVVHATPLHGDSTRALSRHSLISEAETVGKVDKKNAPAKASCEVHGILARKNGNSAKRIPANLSFMEEQLASDQFAAYKSFHLLELRTLDLIEGSSAEETRFGSGHRVKLQLVGQEKSRLKLHATLLSANAKRTLLDTNYQIRSGSIVIFAGGAHADGTLVFAIVCRSQSPG